MHHRPDLYTRWSLEMRRKEFFHAGQRMGVAVSGGPDSVLLLHFMQTLAREGGLTLAAVHFNHHLRGAESDGDEALVRDLAASLQIEYLRGEAEVGRVARERGRNLEAVARELRYRFFFSLVDQGRLDRVATAHTANDQAETVLMRLLRGTGTRGLGGIYPVLEGKVVRPFLGLTRAEVMQEIAARRLPYRVDSSNLNTRLQRNKVRMELLPLLTKEYNPEIIPLLNQFADRARDDEACLERLRARSGASLAQCARGRKSAFPFAPCWNFLPPWRGAFCGRCCKWYGARRTGSRTRTLNHCADLPPKRKAEKSKPCPAACSLAKSSHGWCVGPMAGRAGRGRLFLSLSPSRENWQSASWLAPSASKYLAATTPARRIILTSSLALTRKSWAENWFCATGGPAMAFVPAEAEGSAS